MASFKVRSFRHADCRLIAGLIARNMCGTARVAPGVPAQVTNPDYRRAFAISQVGRLCRWQSMFGGVQLAERIGEVAAPGNGDLAELIGDNLSQEGHLPAILRPLASST
jgi:hypothetical protein